MTLFIDPKNYPNALGPSATNQPTVLRCASTRWILPVLIFGDAVSTVSHVVMGQLSERGAHRWCQDIPVASKLRRQQSELSGTKLRNQSARFSDLHVRRSVSKSHQSWGEVLGSHR